jgi:pimeloyl-ACP methyl ester carboxylesterase
VSPVVRAGALDLWYESQGDEANPPMLLLAGVGVQATQWSKDACTQLVDAGFRVIRYDHRDVGLSTKLDDAAPVNVAAALQGDFSTAAYQLDDMADDAVRLLDALGIESAHFVGESMGGMIAQIVAIQHPERVRSLALLFTTTGDPKVGQISDAGRARLMSRTTDGDQSRDAVVERWFEGRRATATAAFPIDEAIVRAEIAAAVDRSHHPAGRVRQMVAMGAQWDRTERLADVKAPAIVIHGTDDMMIDVSGAYALAEALPNAELMVIDGLGHDWPASLTAHLVDAIVENAKRA